MSTVRLGVLGAARILQNAVVTPAASVPEIEVTAIAARDRSRAQEMAERDGIPRVLDDYDALLADPDVDAVYVPTPAALHGVWMLRAIAAGKHVLCEKPFTANADEAEDVAAAAAGSGLVVMEAFHSQHHPSWARLRELLAEGAIGDVVSAEADFCVEIADRSDIRWQESMGGGALMDLGVYPLRFLTHVLGAPTVRSAEAVEVDGVDASIVVHLDLPGGVDGTVRASMVQAEDHQVRARITGTAGTITVEAPYAPQNGGRILVERDGETREEPVDPTGSYVWMLRSFADAVLRGGDPVSGTTQAVAAMRLVDDAYRAAGMAPRQPAPLR
ncbi:Gfo/Idh/MocA family protein [Cellulomonas hominis]|uniref:Gfo/Idh/MocA family protein n=1 Tax=Cellulomonas hominis TaxID=156981 RepID=UPI001B8DD919|nr:Gfo/Idh/MocA family oxidoreductase [Cellulomonas hominis]VTR75760.1 1,5-anhydro-D-fructose reductase [Cellulomonas hominis]